MIQFNIDHAAQLRNSIASFQAIYSEEWLDLIQRLQDLQQVWNDTHRLDFERDFNNLTTIHQQIDRELEPQLQELDRTVTIVDKMNETLIDLNFSDQRTVTPSSQTAQTDISNENIANNPKESNPPLTEESVQEWQKSWSDLSQTVMPFLNKTCAIGTLSLSLFGGIISSPSISQVTKISNQMLSSGIGFIVDDFQKIVDLNNDTLGSEHSSLPDDSIFKAVSKITEDAEKLHFGNDDIADVISDYADDDERKRERRRHEQTILNQLRSKYSQTSSGK